MVIERKGYLLDKTKGFRSVRFDVHKEDYNRLSEYAHKRHMPLATWARKELMEILEKETAE